MKERYYELRKQFEHDKETKCTNFAEWLVERLEFLEKQLKKCRDNTIDECHDIAQQAFHHQWPIRYFIDQILYLKKSERLGTIVKLKQEAQRLREYAQHKQECKLFGFTSFEKKTKGCTCGLDKLLNQEER